MSRDILKLLSTAEIVALQCKGVEWPHALLAETLIPDAWLGLVVKPDGRRRLVPAGEDPHPDRDDTLVLVRNRAITVPLEFAAVSAADGHAVRATVELLLRPTPRDDELAALHRTLLVKDELTLGDLAATIEQGGARKSLDQFLRTQTARELVYGDIRDNLCSYLRGQINRFLFSAGLTLERLGRLEFASATLAQDEDRSRSTTRRVKELESRGVVEQAALAATNRRLEGLSGLLAKLKAASAGEGAARWRDLLPVLTPSERGRLLENLWRLTPDRTAAVAIVAVAGHACIWLDPQQPEQVVRQVALPEELGGLRSVAYAANERTLLVGAARGVWRVDADNGSVVGRHAIPGTEPVRTGFNAAVVAGGCLVATHSQLGAWLWSLSDASDVRPLLRPVAGVPRTIRGATVDEYGRILIAADNRVQIYSVAGALLCESGSADAALHCLQPLEGCLYAGTASGAVLRCELKTPGAWVVLHRAAAAIESLDARRWDDLVELVIPAGAQGVCGVYADEGIVSRLLETPLPIRRVWTCDDTLVALTDARDRLVVLNGSMPARTGREVPIARLLGRPVEHACIVTRRAETEEPRDEGRIA